MRKKDYNVITGYTNQYIEILGSDNIPNEYGGSDPNSNVYWATNAKVKPVFTKRQSSGGNSEIIQAYEFVVRYRDDKNLQNDMLLRWRDNIFTIFNYRPDVVYQDFIVFRGINNNQGNLQVTPST